MWSQRSWWTIQGTQTTPKGDPLSSSSFNDPLTSIIQRNLSEKGIVFIQILVIAVTVVSQYLKVIPTIHNSKILFWQLVNRGTSACYYISIGLCNRLHLPLSVLITMCCCLCHHLFIIATAFRHHHHLVTSTCWHSLMLMPTHWHQLFPSFFTLCILTSSGTWPFPLFSYPQDGHLYWFFQCLH